MGSSKEITLLTKLLNKLPSVKQNIITEYQPWRDEVFITLEKLFGNNSQEYNRFYIGIRSYPLDEESKDEEIQRLLFYLNKDEQNLKSIIKMQETKEKLNKVLRVQRAIKWIKSLIIEFWQSIKSHRIRSIISTVLIIGITLLGTNWTTVQENFIKFLDLFR